MSNYQAFHCSRIGAAHVRAGLPMQDRSDTRTVGSYRIAVVADGHGNRRHFRSDRGAEIACRTAIERIREFILNSPADSRSLDERLAELKLSICISWRDAVTEDIRENPWTETELAEVRQILNPEAYERLISGEDRFLPYGSTLCTVFADADQWTALQLGDGCFVCIDRDGEYTWPMPESLFNEGNRTTSLCMPRPMDDFRHCSGSGHPAGLLVFTDGIEKVFPSQGKDIVSLLHWIWNNEKKYGEAGIGNLEATLDRLTSRSRIGDDVSVAGLVDPDAGEIDPKMTVTQARIEEEHTNARIRELQSSLTYNRQRLRQLKRSGGDKEAIQKLQTVIERNRQELARLAPDLVNDEPEEIPEPETPPFSPEDDPGSAAPFPDQADTPYKTDLITNRNDAQGKTDLISNSDETMYKTDLLPNRAGRDTTDEREDSSPFGEEPPAEAESGFRLRAGDQRKKSNRQTCLLLAAAGLILAAGILMFLLSGHNRRAQEAARATDQYEHTAAQQLTDTFGMQLTASQSSYETSEAENRETQTADAVTAAALNTVQAEWTQTAAVISAGPFRPSGSGDVEPEAEDTPVPEWYIEQQMQTVEAEITAVAGAVGEPEIEIFEPTDFTHETPVPEGTQGTPISPLLIEYTLSPTSIPSTDPTDTLSPTQTPTETPAFTATSTCTPYTKPTNIMTPAELFQLGEEAFGEERYDEAFAYLQPAADAGSAEAQYRLAGMYKDGLGVKQDRGKAYDYYHMAADQEYPAAQCELGILFEEDQDYPNARYWYDQAIKNGNAYAYTRFGLLYLNQMPPDYRNAFKFFSLAEKKKDPEGTYYLGYMYENGLTGRRNMDQAIDCYQKAAELGYEPAMKKLESLGYPPK